MIEWPLLSEKAIGLIESENKIVFIFPTNVTKKEIKEHIEKKYAVKVKEVNTLNSMKGFKKAFVKLDSNFKASDLAAKLKII
ncbi:MAG: 50S ribosomal protein L23 [archaeon]